MEKVLEYSQEQPLLVVNGLSKVFGNNVILRDIGTESNPFTIYNVTRPGMQQGQIVSIVGKSGSGKSTLFKMIAGIHTPSTGVIQIPNPSNPTVYRNVRGGDVGFVQQTYPVSRNQTVFSMLKDAAIQGKVPKNDRKSVIYSYLEEWGLKDQRFHSKNQLSGGQRQRVAIIEQLLCSHSLMIFDEPFSGLDVKNIEDVKESFSKITTTSEIGTILFSTHDIHLAVELSDQVYVIGFEKDANQAVIPGGTVIKSYDLKAMGLAWTTYGASHREVGVEIANIIKNN